MLQEFINFTLKHKKPEPALKKYVYELAQKAHCFKIEPIEGIKKCIDPEKIIKPALPFKECWFEPLGNDSLLALYPEDKSSIFFIKGILIEEKTPYNYDLYLYMAMKNGDSVHNITPICINKEFIERMKITEKDSVGLFLIEIGYYNAIEFIEQTLERMQQNEMIVVKNPKKIKATGKPNFTINQYIKITNKKRVYGEYVNKKENFEYSYRFEVRGHWRKLPEGSMGKDRNGEYSIEGYTWVNEYEKGSKDLPLLKKTRIIE